MVVHRNRAISSDDQIGPKVTVIVSRAQQTRRHTKVRRVFSDADSGFSRSNETFSATAASSLLGRRRRYLIDLTDHEVLFFCWLDVAVIRGWNEHIDAFMWRIVKSAILNRWFNTFVIPAWLWEVSLEQSLKPKKWYSDSNNAAKFRITANPGTNHVVRPGQVFPSQGAIRRQVRELQRVLQILLFSQSFRAHLPR